MGTHAVTTHAPVPHCKILNFHTEVLMIGYYIAQINFEICNEMDFRAPFFNWIIWSVTHLDTSLQ